MSAPSSTSRSRLLVYLLCVAGLMAVAAALGLWLGALSVPDIPPAVSPNGANPAALPRVTATGAGALRSDKAAPPLFFQADPEHGGSWDIVTAEIKMAAEAGVHQHVVPVNAPWNGKQDMESVLAPLARVLNADPKAILYLRVNLNPPEDWLRANIDHAAKIGGQTKRYPTPSSPLWIDAARNALEVLANGLARGSNKAHVAGYVLCALQDGLWQRPGYDESPAAASGFREWLRRHYDDDATLQTEWGNSSATLDGAAIPAPPDTAAAGQVFFSAPEAPNVDYLQYLSESTADAIAALTVHLKSVAGPDMVVFAPYGYTYEQLRNDSGHFGLGVIINSDINGFAGPVSYSDRGLGGVGAVMGPVTSVLFHDKQWLLVDDTRTGVAPDPDTGALARMKGLRSEDVFNVQRRNFATALIHGLGVVWSDPEGKGWLHDEEQWREFSRMREIYAQVLQREAPGPDGQVSIPDDPACQPPPLTHAAPLIVVVDELSRFRVREDERLHALLLHQARDAAVRSGMPTRFCLLQDILDDRIAPGPVYLFLNAFFLPEDDRTRIHEILRREQAAAIWMFAPGYINGGAAVENIGATTRMNVKQFEGRARSGSVFSLPGPWAKENEAFGASEEWSPLFYIDDPDVDTLAQYADSRKTSLAIRFLDEGWASVYMAEPALTPSVLREVLRILEQRLYFSESNDPLFDTAHAGRGLLAIHAQANGERAVDMGRYYNLNDLFDARIGWPRQRNFLFSMKLGETRLLALDPLPIEQQEANEGEAVGENQAPAPQEAPPESAGAAGDTR